MANFYVEAIEDTYLTISKIGTPLVGAIYYKNQEDLIELTYGSPLYIPAGTRYELLTLDLYDTNFSTTNYINFSSTEKIKIGGNINSLIGSQTKLTRDFCFYKLFANCTTLVDISELILLSDLNSKIYCYASMFNGCTGLTSIPDGFLQATTLTNSCYSCMFKGCNNLVIVPSNLLPATILTLRCYEQMFYNCSKLRKAPNINATILGNFCCYQMFYKCTSLTAPIKLPSLDLVQACYNEMFYGCSKIKLSSAQSDVYTESYRIPTTGTGTVSDATCLYGMFTNTGGSFKGNPVINTTYYYSDPFSPDPTNNFLCFEAVENGNISFNINGTLAITPIIYYSFDKTNWTKYTFGNTISLTAGQKCYFAGDNDLFSESASAYITFASTGNVKASGNIMSLLDSACESKIIPNQYCFYYLFANCFSLLTAPELPATTLTRICYGYMFYGCRSLTEAPELPATTLASSCYSSMFDYCRSLTEAPDLPATTLADQCYSNMFQNCTSLTEAPDLPATTLANRCYDAMFNRCSNIKLSETKINEYWKPYRIPSEGTGTVRISSLDNMFANTGGTFKGTPTINKTYYLVAPIPYNIIVDSEKGQLASDATKSGEYAYNTQIKAHVTAKPHWEFKHYLIKSSNDDIIEDNPYIFNLTNEIELEAVFATSYLIDITVEGNGTTTYTHTDTEITFTTVPDEHNIFIKYIINDISYYDNPLTIPYDQDMTVVTQLSYIGREFSYSSSDGGTVTTDKPAGVYDIGTTITLEAHNDYRWHFIGWYRSDGYLLSTQNPYTHTLDADITIEGRFDEDERYYVNLTSNLPGNNIWQSEYRVYYGDTVTFRVRDVAGYVFLKWSDDSTEKNRTLTVTSEINLNAIYYKVAEESSGSGGFEWRCFVKSLYNPITHEGINSEVKAMLGVRSFTIANDLLTTANSSIVVYDLPEETIYEGDVLMLYNPQGKPRYYGIIKSISDKTKDNPTVTIQCEQMQSFYKGLWIKEIYRTKTTVEEEFAYLLDRYANGYMKGFPSGTRDTLQYYEKAPIKVLSVPGATANLVAPTEATETEDMETYIYSLYEKYQIMLDFYIPFGSWTIGADSPTGATVTVKKFSLAQDENPLVIFDNNNAIMNLTPTTETEENNILMVYNENGNYRTSYVVITNDDGTVSIVEGLSNIEGRFKDIKKQIVFSDDALDNIKKENLSTEMFNHHISFSLLIDNNLYKFDDFKLGMPINIYHNGNMYKSVITGMQISKDAGANVLQANFTCGFVRTTLTKKLSRKLGIIK